MSQAVASSGTTDGIRVEQNAISMRPVRDREHRGCPVLYQQGTHTYSTRFHSGTTQTFSAQAVTPPRPRGYLRPFLVWGPAIIIFFVWTVAGFGSIYEQPRSRGVEGPSTVTVFLFLGAASLVGMAFSLRSIARYNREVYPRLHWNWEHTYICRRCGNSRLIPS